MNEIELTSNAERKAELAEKLRAFSGIKLLHIKRQIASILSQIGKDGIFDEYTKHDISHIDYMLDSLDWIIPQKTQEKLSSSEWLMITLSIYFHDLGMLVTKEEYEHRTKNSFPSFKQSVLDGNLGDDFKEKISSILDESRKDRFLYQEFVRRSHADRIKYWILDEFNSGFSSDLKIIGEIKKLLESLDNMFRRDLALVCESHHLSDLDDFNKYKPNQQYGPSIQEIVNLQYCALILRTADLLHITSDRTPSIEFNLISPTDPKSQEEWAKQKSVKTVRPRVNKDKEGNLNESIPKDTFEIIALFDNDEGFFGLISYLNYANRELQENFRFNELCRKRYGFTDQYQYPWKAIDDSSIETKDFEKRKFEFVLDQTKILDLLVGHTLYNDSTVVLRELTQNAIDASKLKKYELEKSGLTDYIPRILIKWDEKLRELSFIDNGTGMTIDIIHNHLLKVGSSRYQDNEFKKKHPGFSPISRFGIGLLTCFLIADDIDIVTKSSENEKAILLKIKKVHGKYLLKYLNENNVPKDITKHGTIIKLYVRGNINLRNIEKELKKWIMFPNCDLQLENNGKLISIGYDNPTMALTKHLEELGYRIGDNNIKVKEVYKDGLTLAYALKYHEHWKEWTFLECNDLEGEYNALGTCIEGIRVDFDSPGFKGASIYAIANSTGINAPKTNVARSNIEITPERNVLLQMIYQLYLEQMTEELNNLTKTGFSITWAASEINWILNSFVKYPSHNRRVEIIDNNLFEKALAQIKCILVEQENLRSVISLNDLIRKKHFWKIDCVSFRSADSLIKEIKSSNISSLALLNTIFGTDESQTKHIDVLLCNQISDSVINKIINKNFQVDSIKIIQEQRRLDMRWSSTKEKIWEIIDLTEDSYSLRPSNDKCYIQLVDIDIDKQINQTAIGSSSNLFILKNSEINAFLVKLINKLSARSQEDNIAISRIINLFNSLFYYKELDQNKIEEFIDSRFKHSNNRDIEKIVWTRVSREELLSAILQTNFVKFDTNVWYRRMGEYI